MHSKNIKFAFLCVGTIIAILIANAFFSPKLPNFLNIKNSQVESVLSYDIVDLNNTPVEKLHLLYGVSEDEALSIHYRRLHLQGLPSIQDVCNVVGVSENDVAMWGERVTLTPLE